MVANDAFFQQPQAAAVLKHGVLSRYTTVYGTMAGTATGQVTYFDGYAGPGRYDDGSPGSPLLVLESARRMGQWGRSVRCFFVEKNRAHAKALRKVLTDEAPAELEWEVRHGDVEDHVDEALEFAGDDPMLTFLDPFGTALNYTTLTTRLLRRPRGLPTEVLLNLNLEMVRRVGGLLGSKSPRASDEATLARLDSLFGSAWWRAVFAGAFRPGEDGSAAAAAWSVAGEFAVRIKADTGFGYFGVPVRRRPTHAPLFVLILLYRNPIAPWKFNEQVSLANGDWREACWQRDTDLLVADLGQQEDLFGDQTEGLLRESEHDAWTKAQKQLESDWVDSIASNLRSLLTAQPRFMLRTNVPGVYGKTLGLARDMHVKRAWDQLATAEVAAARDKKRRLENSTIERAIRS